jgi:hypothetical protein
VSFASGETAANGAPEPVADHIDCIRWTEVGPGWFAGGPQHQCRVAPLGPGIALAGADRVEAAVLDDVDQRGVSGNRRLDRLQRHRFEIGIGQRSSVAERCLKALFLLPKVRQPLGVPDRAWSERRWRDEARDLGSHGLQPIEQRLVLGCRFLAHLHEGVRDRVEYESLALE